jgi:hypothetical protein
MTGSVRKNETFDGLEVLRNIDQIRNSTGTLKE